MIFAKLMENVVINVKQNRNDLHIENAIPRIIQLKITLRKTFL